MPSWGPISVASTAASSNSFVLTGSNLRRGRVTGAAWAHPTSAASTSVFSIVADGSSVFNGAGMGAVGNLNIPFSSTVEVKWLSSSPGAAVMVGSIWGEYD